MRIGKPDPNNGHNQSLAFARKEEDHFEALQHTDSDVPLRMVFIRNRNFEKLATNSLACRFGNLDTVHVPLGLLDGVEDSANTSVSKHRHLD